MSEHDEQHEIEHTFRREERQRRESIVAGLQHKLAGGAGQPIPQDVAAEELQKRLSDGSFMARFTSSRGTRDTEAARIEMDVLYGAAHPGTITTNSEGTEL